MSNPILYVLAVEQKNLNKLSLYISSLRSAGLTIEMKEGEKVKKHFILIKMSSDKVMESYAEQYKVDKCPLMYAYKSSERLTELPTFTTSQCLYVLNKILEDTKFSESEGDVGLTRLIKRGLINKAYPLHDDYQRACLSHWYGNFFINFTVPLDKIFEYFGWEITFYFSYLQFFNIMLLPVALLGLFMFMASMIIAWTFEVEAIDEVCHENDMYVCPICNQKNNCVFQPLSHYCFYATWTYVFDNYWTIIYAIATSVWATIYLKCWTLKENTQKYKWGVEMEEIETEPRSGYVRRDNERFSKKYKLFPSLSIFLFLLLIILAGYTSVEFYKILTNRINFKFETTTKFLSITIVTLFQTIFLKISDKIYEKLSFVLTDLANPKTDLAYNKRVLYKRFILSFTNYFSYLFYVAFVKGNLYKTPMDIDLIFFKQDSCQPTTCVVELSVSLCLLIVFKKLTWILLYFVKTVYLTKKKENSNLLLPQYEIEYFLPNAQTNLMSIDFSKIIIDFGFVTFFIAVTPLAPLLIFINNYLEIRLLAFNLIKRRNRPVPKRTVGIGEWNGILLGLTYLSTATNAFVMTFTSDFISRKMYRSAHEASIKGYVNSTLSKFLTSDVPAYSNISKKVEVCYYKGLRFPPEHPKKYENTDDYWKNLALKFIYVFIFEHVIYFCNTILAYLMPTVPFNVKELRYYNRYTARRKIMETEKTDIEDVLHM